MSARCDFAMAVLKGAVEHGDGTAYFGSLIGYTAHRDAAVRAGYVRIVMVKHPEGFDVQREQPTEAGEYVYRESGLADLPRSGRAYAWDWSRVAPTAGGESTKGGW